MSALRGGDAVSGEAPAVTPSDGLDVDVLVVGAGPVGLMAAGELARHGASVRLVERATGRTDLSKALVVHARTLEMMDLAGIAEGFVARGYPAPGVNVGLNDAGKQLSVNMRLLDSRFPYMLVLPQRRTEELLERRLTELGVQVETGCELVAVDQDDDLVRATLRSAAGTEVMCRTRYLIGSDGAHSSVRHLLNLPFEGEQLDELVLIADVRADTEFVRSRITNFTSSRGFVSILPFLGDHVRVFVVDFANQIRRDEELTLRELQDAVNAIVPTPIEMSDATWLTRYTAPSRRVSTTHSGRVFLAGDAAHAHSPAGGQGMNTGLQDAANIAWKLAMVTRGDAPAELLDSYNPERQAVHVKVGHATDRMFRAFVLRNPVLKLMRNAAAGAVVPLAPVQHRLAETLSGLAISYPAGESSDQADRSTGSHPPRATAGRGDRVPDVPLWEAGAGESRMYEVLRHGRYTMFVYAAADRIGASRAQIRDLVRFVAGTYPGGVHVRVVIDEGVFAPADFGGAAISVDVRGEFATKLGAEHGSVLLVRPDAYVAFHQVGLDLDEVVRAVDPWALRTPDRHPRGSTVREEREGTRS